MIEFPWRSESVCKLGSGCFEIVHLCVTEWVWNSWAESPAAAEEEEVELPQG